MFPVILLWHMMQTNQRLIEDAARRKEEVTSRPSTYYPYVPYYKKEEITFPQEKTSKPGFLRRLINKLFN